MKPTVKLVYVTADGREWSNAADAAAVQRELALRKLVHDRAPGLIAASDLLYVEKLVLDIAPKIAEVMAKDFNPENHDGPKITPIESGVSESALAKSLAKTLK